MASMQGKIPITDWNSTIHSTRSTDESFDDGGFEEYWEKMELLDLDEAEVNLETLEFGPDEDFESSIRSYLKDMTPPKSASTKFHEEGNTYADLLRQVNEHLVEENAFTEMADDPNDYDDDDYEEESPIRHPSTGLEDPQDGFENQEDGNLDMMDDNDDLFDDYEEDLHNVNVARSLSLGGGLDDVRVKASQEVYSDDDNDNYEEEEFLSQTHVSEKTSNVPLDTDIMDEDYEDDCEEDDEAIDYIAQSTGQNDTTSPTNHVHAGYGLAPEGALTRTIDGTGLFSPSKMKQLLDEEGSDDDNSDDHRSNHSRSKTIDRSKVAVSDHPESRGAEVIFSANSFAEDGYGDDGAAPVFTYKDFEFLPPEEEESEDDRKHIPKRHPSKGKAPIPSRRKININQGPSAPPKIKKAGPYSQAKLGAPPGVQRKKKGKNIDPEQVRKNKENRDRHKMMLDMIALKRKEQEDEAVHQLMKAEAKRKLFKEALLEKALRKRAETPPVDDELKQQREPTSGQRNRPKDVNLVPEEYDGPPAPRGTFMEPTKAYEAQKMPARKRQDNVEDENERARKDEEKYEKVAQLRRKFKDQHKQILMNILIKKREAEKKKEEEEKLEAHRANIKKMKRDQRLAKKAAEAAAVYGGEENDGKAGTESPKKKCDENASNSKRRSKSGGVAVATTAPDDGSFGTTIGVNGAAPLIRSRSRGESKEELNGSDGDNNLRKVKLPRRKRLDDNGLKIDPIEADTTHPSRRNRSSATESEGKYDRNVAKGNRNTSKREGAEGNVNSPHNKDNTSGSDCKNDAMKRNLNALDEELSLEAAKKQKQKRLEAKLAREKIDAQLQAVAIQRKQAAEEEKKQQERMRRRVEALASRIVQEAQISKKDDVVESEVAAESNEAKSAKVKKVTPEMAEAMVARLQAKVQKTAEGIALMSNSTPPARDFVDWKRKNNVPLDSRVFSMTGWYPCVKDALLNRGWMYNSDPLSPYFDLKWTLRSSDIGLESLQPWQLTNHFLKNIAITTKAGLNKSLRELVWQADMHADDILPRAYDLSVPSELYEFVNDFRLQKAEGILKGLYAKIIGNSGPLKRPPRPETARNSRSDGNGQSGEISMPAAVDSIRPHTARLLYETAVPLPECQGLDPDSFFVNKAVFETCCAVLERHLRPNEDDYLDESEEKDEEIPMTALEWELLSHHTLYEPSKGGLPDTPPDMLGPFGKETSAEDVTAAMNDPLKSQKLQAAQHRSRRKQRKLDASRRDEANQAVVEMVAVGRAGLERVHKLLFHLQALSANQSGLNGHGQNSNNIWIVKPAAKSRGRGITTFTELDKLLQYCDVAHRSQGSGGGGATMWIVQKYMENPLLIANRKFDMRQWVLVTDWNPLTIYFFDEAYCRFSSEEYTTDEAALNNAFVHLVNQSVSKCNQDKKSEVVVPENGEVINGYMWSCAQFQKYLKHISEEVDIWSEKLQPRMKEIAKVTLSCAVDMIEHRKNSWELYGFDFMVDDEFNAWLIEVNSSPACDYSTATTERYVQKALVDLLSVTLDVRTWEATPRKERGERPDTGGWECIYKGPLLETPAASFGSDMAVKGSTIKVPRRNPISNQPNSMTMNLESLNTTESSLICGGDIEKKCDSRRLTVPKFKTTRRQISGVENAPNSCSEDITECDIDYHSTSNATLSKPIMNHVKTTKAVYDPSSLSLNGNFEEKRKLGDKGRLPPKDVETFFDDSSGDDEGASQPGKQGSFAGDKRNRSSSKKISTADSCGVAVPVKVFSVDF